ncbi:glycosyltransferase [Pseudozyma hubeiensis SY62]|uniref:UDP-N-acetylglucosamine transferase subunit ALG14 n=1 Tax=Pseudozyma hubeiensis (strain SY62) TaxID=1305764 RepID=R9P3C1_PSEHS|nr:glycosyltransferase [Pseudozyma hubeiensis SY62]GAC95933.1 glycosyltransferase [Pseudozyma hubeiensis SY62]
MDALAEKLEEGKLYLQRPINEVLPPRLLLYLLPPVPPLRFVLAALALTLLLVLRVWFLLPGRRSAQSPTSRSSRDAGTAKHRSHGVAVFLGSGGHTTELLQLVSALPTQRYTRRIYLVSSGDHFSLEKAKKLEKKLSSSSSSSDSQDPPDAKVIQIPRARNVHQSFLTTPITLAKSIVFCVDHVSLRPLLRRVKGGDGILADVILMNGPGTCVPIVAAVYLLRVSHCSFVLWLSPTSTLSDHRSACLLKQIAGLRSPKLIYVESFARVKSLSLTAKLIRPFVDRFVLQWPRDASSTPPHIRAKATPNTVYSGWLV